MPSFKFSSLLPVLMVITMFGGALALDANVLTDFKAVGDGVTDDSNAFEEAWKAVCASTDPSNNLIIPSPNTFLVNPISLQGPCNSPITVKIMGSLVAPKESNWPKNPTKKDKKLVDWLSFSKVDNLFVKGSATGSINGRATICDFWKRGCPGKGKNKPCEDSRPTSLAFHYCNKLQVIGLASRDPPMNHLSINGCNGVDVANVDFRADESSPNTDGIDISISTNINIHDSFIGTGDDCIAINNGSSSINITNLNCGPGHGISVGSLGKDFSHETAQDIHVKNCTFNGTTNGARIKTWDGGSGFARNITFEDIILINADHPIVIDQHYCPNGSCPRPPKPNAVEISSVSFKGVQGTSKAKVAIDISCSSFKHCHDIVLDGINISSSLVKVESNCSNVDGLISLNTVVPPVKCSILPARTEEGFISMPVVVEQNATHEEDRSEL